MIRDELVADLARVIAETFGWDWTTEDEAPPILGCDTRTPSPAECCQDPARAVLDRLEALGWTPPREDPLPLGGPGQGTQYAERAEQVLPPSAGRP